jgi:glycerophosphoryl diester phosphodiesterase
MKKTGWVLLVLVALSCKGQQDNRSVDQSVEKAGTTYNFELQGHRGSRGLAPENTIPAFKKALEIGVNTLELDVVISKDKQVVVSHEPWLNYKITSDSLRNPLTEKEGLAFSLYQHSYKEISTFDVGSRGNALFPEQEKQKVSKPLLTEVIAMAESVNPKILYNIEIKSTTEDEAKGFQPNVKEFSDILIALLKEKLPLDRVVIQSFDTRVLQYIHSTYPEYVLSYLVEKDNFKKNSEKLGFVPPIYSPYSILLTPAEVNEIHKKKVRVIPWTVNNVEEMKKLLSMGVDGLITDYPNLALPLRN